jgi:Tol biopolymer transport system component
VKLATLLAAALQASLAHGADTILWKDATALIRPGETHFAELRQLTFGGQNAEAYWSNDGRRLVFQSTRDGAACDQEYVMDVATAHVTRVSTGRGRCTCGYFYDHDRRILFSSTHATEDTCPPRPDYSRGYVWPVDVNYDIYTARPDGSDLRRLTDTPGYDAETTVSTDGKWLVFTSDRDGDLDVYKMHPDGSDVTRLTHTLGYDGGPWMSRDGRWIVYRGYHPTDSSEVADYRALLAQHLVRPTKMDLWIMRADGSGQRQITHDPGASFGPYFTPDGSHIIYASNFEHPTGEQFNLYMIPRQGGRPVAVTHDSTFNAFPMFSPDGRWLVFASNRGGHAPHETNLFLARWKP